MLRTRPGSALAILIGMALASLCLSGCGGRERPQDSVSVFGAVLRGEEEFFSTDAKKHLYLADLKQTVSSDDSVTVTVGEFAVVDLDEDGAAEIVLGLAVNGNDNLGYEVFRFRDGTAYGYTLWHRAFMDLKTDGTFSFSGGSADNGFGSIVFTDDGYAIHKISYCESAWDSRGNQIVSYFVHNASATEDAFLESLGAQDQKPDVLWLDFADANLDK